MARIAAGYCGVRERAAYVRNRNGVWRSMISHCALEEHNGIPLMSQLYQIADLEDGELKPLRKVRQRELATRRYPFNGDSLWSPYGFEEAFWAARERVDANAMERYLRYAYASRSLSPCWWWYATDKRWLDTPYAPPHPGMADKGEMCFGPSTLANSLIYLSMLDRDSDRIDYAKLRMAFGGLMGVWSLVRDDGSASMGFCPDAASKQFGMSWTTGDIGLGLFQYLRGVSSYVLASRTEGLQTFGCHFDALDEGPDERFVLKPWDGVARRVVVRHLGLEVISSSARIRELSFDAAKRNATLALRNTSDKRLRAEFSIKGLWGERFTVDGAETQARNGCLTATVEIAAHGTHRANIKVIDA
jgi:hypothetical protein